VKEKRGDSDGVYEAVRRQYREHWGQPSQRTQYEVDGTQVAVYKWAADAHPQGVAVYATVGASSRAVPGRGKSHRAEFFVGLLPEQDEVGRPLADLILHAEREGVDLDHGQAVPTKGPLWPGTQMDSFVVVRPHPPALPPLSHRGVSIEFLQAVPVAPAVTP